MSDRRPCPICGKPPAQLEDDADGCLVWYCMGEHDGSHELFGPRYDTTGGGWDAMVDAMHRRGGETMTDMFCPHECVNFRWCGCRARCLKFSRNVLDIDKQGRFLKWGVCGLEGWMSIAKVDVEVKR